ncbi:glycosyltransferase [Flavobacterium sp. NST-5]|uniref:Glycosyltransferase n=1 Tax=Flavobacterium ichthyis TaxID=2698827 RepID=A0ABW9Z954_9FLAO|nr:glycosyltransferase [Flavobacterium ichthyis]NBL65251.1 glycosyltransferase [Flavobacterium ichthyis]
MKSKKTNTQTPETSKNVFPSKANYLLSDEIDLPEILFITSYPPRECGIATYSQDLMRALNKQFVSSFKVSVCALENNNERHLYHESDVKYTLNTSESSSYDAVSEAINANDNVKVVVLQHEFGLFAENFDRFHQFITEIKKPLVVAFHTVLPRPDEVFKVRVQHILDRANHLIVMTDRSAEILQEDYIVDAEKIAIIPHGTHLVPYADKNVLKTKYGVKGRKILSTFGLLSRGKSIETTLEALPKIVDKSPEVLFLIIGKTHPGVIINEGESYRESLEAKIKELKLENNVQFVNKYLPLNELLDYLQLTDIYLFTSKDPNQAVSGTFSYAMSCGCAIVSTPIPHAKEMLKDGSGLTFDFGNSVQLAEAVNQLIFDVGLRKNMMMNGLHKIMPTAWENSAVAHAILFQKASNNSIHLHYRNPEVNSRHIKKMTDNFGMFQFCKINKPDPNSGYTLDDNARALIAFCQNYKYDKNIEDLQYISLYLNFIEFCQQRNGMFLNYVDVNKNFTPQNNAVNLEDSCGRAIWALGYLISLSPMLPSPFVKRATTMFEKAIENLEKIHSPRAIAFTIKGLYYYNRQTKDMNNAISIKILADKLIAIYDKEAHEGWNWFESYLTYANSVLPESLLCAYAVTNEEKYGMIAKKSFKFLLDNIFTENQIRVISNKSWHVKGQEKELYGEQPIDVAYTILALRKFHDIFKDEDYLNKMEIAFNWFLGNNHLKQIIYNPCTGGCFDGLEEKNVNLNQGAESTLSYFIARLTISKYFGNANTVYFRKKLKAAKQILLKA